MLVLERPSENLGDTKDAATIVQTNFMKWQTQLSEAEVRDVESVAGSLMRDLDYEPRFIAGDSDVSSLKMNLLRVKDTWRRFQFVLSEEKNLRATLARMSRVGRF
jgi:hypothetical protein